jgi:hypothetical protein
VKRLLLPLILLTTAAVCFTGVFRPEFRYMTHNWNTSLTLRLMGSRRIGCFKTQAAWVVSPGAGNPAPQGTPDGYSQFRIADPDTRIYPENWSSSENFSVVQNIDRLSIQTRLKKLRITLGRQAVFWGVSRSVSPTDFIAPFPWGEVNTDYRVGVDAARAAYPMGMMSEIEAGEVFGDRAEAKKSGFWLRTRLYALNTDISILAAEFRENTMAGGSLNRVIGSSVGWIESAVVKPDSGDTYWRLSTGLERSFLNSTFYGFMEYHYNSPGAENHDDYLQNSTQPAYATGGVYLMAKHYAACGFSIAAAPLLTLNAGFLINLNDGSAQATVEADYSLSENSTLNTGISGGLGSEQSEFGSLASSIHLNLSLYF